MGFQRKVYKLKWPEESLWHGLEVRLGAMSIGELEEVARLQSAESEDGASNLERVTPIFDILGAKMISWNLEDDANEPIPVSEFRNEDMSMLLAIVSAWTGAVGDVPTPLKPTSSDGKPSEEALIPMEIPSASQPNSNTPN